MEKVKEDFMNKPVEEDGEAVAGGSKVVNGIKSAERVKKFGEVFTPENIVSDMVDLIPVEADTKAELRKTWLEPACGNGNFLVEILRRKLDAVGKLEDEAKASGEEIDHDAWVFVGVSAIYGIDIQEDNVFESKERMLSIIVEWYKKRYGVDIPSDLKEELKFVLYLNIQLGDTLNPNRDMNNPLKIVEYIYSEDNGGLFIGQYHFEDMCKGFEALPISKTELTSYKELTKEVIDSMEDEEVEF